MEASRPAANPGSDPDPEFRLTEIVPAWALFLFVLVRQKPDLLTWQESDQDGKLLERMRALLPEPTGLLSRLMIWPVRRWLDREIAASAWLADLGADIGVWPGNRMKKRQ